MNGYIGVFKLFATAPIWAIMLFLLIGGVALPFVIADRTTGLFFNFSYSGIVGDVCLTVVLLIGITVIQRSTQFPYWFAGAWPQVLWFVICVTVGVLLVTLTTPWPTATWPDRYHNAVVVPFFFFLLPLMFLAIVCNGNKIEVAASFLLIAIWAAFIVYDFKDGRMNQPERLSKLYGIELAHGRFVKHL